jgi:glutamate 5-kinase
MKSTGNVMIDDGAVRAITKNGNSLLPIGITAVNGEFKRGDVIDIMNIRSEVIARGISNYDASIVRTNIGRRSSQMDTGSEVYDPEIVHRDNMILLTMESL